MPRYKLRTLLLLLAILPPLLAGAWVKYSAWRELQERIELEGCVQMLPQYTPPPGAQLRDGFTLDNF